MQANQGSRSSSCALLYLPHAAGWYVRMDVRLCAMWLCLKSEMLCSYPTPLCVTAIEGDLCRAGRRALYVPVLSLRDTRPSHPFLFCLLAFGWPCWIGSSFGASTNVTK
jgi:hypothetical protein